MNGMSYWGNTRWGNFW
jgi:chitin synthase